MKNAESLTDYNKLQTPAEVWNNVLSQLIRDAAIEQGYDDVVKKVTTPMPEVQSHRAHTKYALQVLGVHSPKAEAKICAQMIDYDESVRENLQSGQSPKIQKLYPGDGYYGNPFVENDDGYGDHEAVADVIDLNGYRELSDELDLRTQ
jgi:hypothetical protein